MMALLGTVLYMEDSIPDRYLLVPYTMKRVLSSDNMISDFVAKANANIG